MSSTTERQSSEPMKPFERREAAVGEQLEVGGLAGAEGQGQGGVGLRQGVSGS